MDGDAGFSRVSGSCAQPSTAMSKKPTLARIALFFMKMDLMVNERVKVMRVITHGMRGLGFLHRVGGNENADSEPRIGVFVRFTAYVPQEPLRRTLLMT